MCVLACASGAVIAATSTPAGASQATDVVITSSSPLPLTAPASALSGAASAVAPATSTPNGFKLIHPGYRRSNYVYDSDKAYQGSYRCVDDKCTLLAEVTVQLHEYVIGGTSHTWQLTANMKEYKNPGHLTWSYFATYYCGVNVAHGNDHECNNGAAPSDAGMSVNDVVNKPWGKTNSITVFPMVAMSTQFSNGPKVTTKFRGYDTLSRARTTKLNTKSGTGN
jgi:hypothetical protein